MIMIRCFAVTVFAPGTRSTTHIKSLIMRFPLLAMHVKLWIKHLERPIGVPFHSTLKNLASVQVDVVDVLLRGGPLHVLSPTIHMMPHVLATAQVGSASTATMMFKHIIEHVVPGRSNVHIGKFRDKVSPWTSKGVQIQRRKGLLER
ncbi:unnamed protein product, partial [Heterosigma akashiwo]